MNLMSIIAVLLLVVVALLYLFFLSPEFRAWTTGFRTKLLAWSIPALLFSEQTLNLLSPLITPGKTLVTRDEIVGTVMSAAIITIKQIVTDAIPRLRGELRK